MISMFVLLVCFRLPRPRGRRGMEKMLKQRVLTEKGGELRKWSWGHPSFNRWEEEEEPRWRRRRKGRDKEGPEKGGSPISQKYDFKIEVSVVHWHMK